jgi:3-hydroxybutyryl-CoA dehydrogenase
MGAGEIAIVGAGRMGRGIALAFAYGGHEARVIDLKPRDAAGTAALSAALWAEIDADLQTLAALGRGDAATAAAIKARIRFEAVAENTDLTNAAVVFEAVPEVLQAKQEAIAWIGRHTAADTPVASTTSSFLVTELAALIDAPERFLNAHWLNPGHIMPLVELSRHPGTSDAALGAVRDLLESIGKVPVVCAAAPGYIVPRLQTLLMNEAARMVAEGVASAEDIDKATRYGLGLRFAALGVIEFIDFGGNDILYHASRYLARTLDDDRFASPPVIAEMMSAGTNGLRDGRGFYDYRGIDREAYRRDVLQRVFAMLEHFGLARPPAS